MAATWVHLVKEQAQGSCAACGVSDGRVPGQQPTFRQRCQLAQGEGTLHEQKLCPSQAAEPGRDQAHICIWPHPARRSSVLCLKG